MEPNNQTEKTDNSKKKGVNITTPLIFVGILLLLAGGYYMVKKNNSPKTNTLTESSVQGVSQQAPEQVALNNEKFISNSDIAVIEVKGSSFKFEPSTFTVSAGQNVKLVFNNTQGFHDLVFENLNIKTKQIQAGEMETLEFTAPTQAGEYPFYCSVGNHKTMGMVGKMIVE